MSGTTALGRATLTVEWDDPSPNASTGVISSERTLERRDVRRALSIHCGRVQHDALGGSVSTRHTSRSTMTPSGRQTSARAFVSCFKVGGGNWPRSGSRLSRSNACVALPGPGRARAPALQLERTNGRDCASEIPVGQFLVEHAPADAFHDGGEPRRSVINRHRRRFLGSGPRELQRRLVPQAAVANVTT